MEISVILPAYNEQENIKDAVTSINKYLQKKFRSFEIVVVNDGSTDKTPAIVKKMAKRNKNLRMVTHPKNRGYGATLRTGFANSQGKLVFYTDSDNQYKIKDLDLFLPLIKKFDIVAGFRTKHEDPLMRIFISDVYNLIIRLLLNLQVKDVDCSFKLIKKEVFKKIKLKSKTGLLEAELFAKAKKAGFSITQVAVNHYPRTKGKTSYEIGKRNKIFAFVHPSVPIEIFKEIKKLWGELR